MNAITQITTHRQAVIKYAEKKGVTATARRYINSILVKRHIHIYGAA